MNDDAFFIYLVKTKTGKLNLRLSIQRFGIYPIDISEYIVETDLVQERIIPNSGEIDRGASNRLYKSIYDVLFTRKIYDIIDKFVKSENSKLRYMGKRVNDWKTIKEKERHGIKDILALYTELGGKFDY